MISSCHLFLIASSTSSLQLSRIIVLFSLVFVLLLQLQSVFMVLISTTTSRGYLSSAWSRIASSPLHVIKWLFVLIVMLVLRVSNLYWVSIYNIYIYIYFLGERCIFKMVVRLIVITEFLGIFSMVAWTSWCLLYSFVNIQWIILSLLYFFMPFFLLFLIGCTWNIAGFISANNHQRERKKTINWLV